MADIKLIPAVCPRCGANIDLCTSCPGTGIMGHGKKVDSLAGRCPVRNHVWTKDGISCSRCVAQESCYGLRQMPRTARPFLSSEEETEK